MRGLVCEQANATHTMADQSPLDHSDLNELVDKAALLAELHNVQAPPVSPWPALGWWLLAFLCLLCVALVVGWQRRKKHLAANAWRREALREISDLKVQLRGAEKKDQHHVVREASALLRRIVMHLDGRTRVAGLIDGDWLQALQKYNDDTGLDPKMRALLIDAPYQPELPQNTSVKDVNELLRWMDELVDNATPTLTPGNR